jgi:hypothetical protein
MSKIEKLLLIILFILLLIGILCPFYAEDKSDAIKDSVLVEEGFGVPLSSEISIDFSSTRYYSFIGTAEENVIEANGDLSIVRIKDDYYKLKGKKDGWIVYKKREEK